MPHTLIAASVHITTIPVFPGDGIGIAIVVLGIAIAIAFDYRFPLRGQVPPRKPMPRPAPVVGPADEEQACEWITSSLAKDRSKLTKNSD